MTPQELKNSILQLAIQGKLVEQRPEEGTAEELYQQIQQEKQKLIREGKIKKEKLLPEISEDEKPFDIPENWKWIKLGNVVRISTGNKDANYGTTNGQYDFFTCAKDPIKAPSYSYNGECIILPGNGANVGMAIYYNGKFEAYQRTYVLERIDQHLSFHYLQKALEWNWAKYNADKMFGSAIPFIKLGNLQNYPFPLPPLAEQKRIVAKIEELLPLIDRYEKAWNRLEEFNKQFPGDLQKSILQMAIQGKLVEQRPEEGTGEELYQQIQAEKQKLIAEGKIKKDQRTEAMNLPQDDDVPFDIPESWKWVFMGSILKKLTDGTHRTPKYATNGVKFVSVKDMSSGVLSLDDTKYITASEHEELFKRCDPVRGDMLLSKVGTTGVPAIVDTDEPFSLFVSVALLKYSHSYIDQAFLYYLLKSPLVQMQATENTRGVGNKNWVLDAIAKTMVVLPPLAEQKRIVARLEELLPLCEALKV